MIVYCDDNTCRYNDGTACRADHIEMKVSTGTREDGTNGAVNVCSGYRGEEDAGAN